MNENYSEMTHKWFELTSEAYRTYFKALVWSQEQALELTKMMTSQAEKTNKGLGLVDEFSGQMQRAQQMSQEAWQQMFKNTTEMVSQYRASTNANIAEITDRMNEFQSKVKAEVLTPTK